MEDKRCTYKHNSERAKLEITASSAEEAEKRVMRMIKREEWSLVRVQRVFKGWWEMLTAGEI